MSEQPSTWPTTTIKKSSYLRGRIGWQGLRASEFLDHGPFLITGTDFLDSGRIDWSRCYHVSEERFREGAYIHVRDGDLLITKDGTIGKIAYVRDCPEKAVLNSGVFLLRCSDGSYDHRFLYQLLRSDLFDTFLRVNLAGSTISHLYQYVFERFEFPVPAAAVQQRIAEILSTVDEAIEQTEALIAKTQQIKAGLMHDLFTRGVTTDGQLRPPREEAPQLYKESPLGWIPKDWETFVLDGSDIAIIDGDRGEHYPQSHELLSYGHCLFLSAMNVTKRGFEFSSKQFITRNKDAKLRTGKLVRGDVIITTRGTVGNIAYYDDAVPFSHVRINSGMVILRSSHPTLLPDFLYASLQQHIFDREYKRVVSGSAQPQLPIRDLKRFNLLLPHADEQGRILARVAAIHDQIASESETRSKLCELKHGLMHDLLTGRVPVTIESAPETKEVAANV